MPLFYGLYVADEKLAAAFDLIRFLAEPYFFRRAHITVRGPYLSPIANQIEENKKQKTYRIHFEGVGSFFSGKQNTVFLKCKIPGVEDVWHKPDYGNEITPHLTFYDGKDRGRGFGLMHLLEKYKWEFVAESSALKEIQTKTHPGAYLDEFNIHQQLYDEILGRRLDYEKIKHEQWSQRLIYLGTVVHYIHVHHGLG